MQKYEYLEGEMAVKEIKNLQEPESGCHSILYFHIKSVRFWTEVSYTLALLATLNGQAKFQMQAWVSDVLLTALEPSVLWYIKIPSRQ